MSDEHPEATTARPPDFDPVKWIKTRLTMQTVMEDGGKWKARFQDKELGEFGSQAEALKAYRKAAEEKFHAGAILPTEEEIDKACPITVRPATRPVARQPAQPAQPAQPTRRR